MAGRPAVRMDAPMATERPPASHRVLVVDDEPALRHVLRRILSQDDYLIDEAADGTSALRMLDTHSYDLILSDVIMPGDLSGIDVLTEAKKRDPDVEVILLTAAAKMPDAVATIKAGAYNYLTKPISGEALRSEVQTALSERCLRLITNTHAHVRHAIRGFRMIRSLGVGQFGMVILVERDGQLFAMKVLRRYGDALTDERLLGHFRRESEIITKLDLPGVVKIHEVGASGADNPFILMEYVDGPSLRTAMAEHLLALPDKLDLLQQLAATVSAVHGEGVIHRDIKPANVLIAAGNRARICDFGTARFLRSVSASAAHFSGTPAYMGPEVFFGNTPVLDARYDIFSLGVVGYELLTGKLPFAAATFADMVHAVAHQRPVAPRKLVPQIPVAVENILARMLAKEPADRYPDAAGLARDLCAAREGHTTVPVPDARALPLPCWA